MYVKPKKHLGQHFLTDKTVCDRMVKAIPVQDDKMTVLEIGPGTGALTDFLLERNDFDTHVIELDRESVSYLNLNYPALKGKIYENDFLKIDLLDLLKTDKFIIAGNFPYNISTQILFKILDVKDHVPMMVGMFQKEVAERIAEPPGSKKYGILSVLLQAFYDIEYLFTVDETVFDPPPKVKSGVVQMVRNNTKSLACDEKVFKQVIKLGFNQRRKTLRNSLKSMITPEIDTTLPIFSLRPERLSFDQFIELTNILMNKV